MVASRPQLVDASPVTDDCRIATHTEPVGRGRANFIVRLDLVQHGMPGYCEQVWTRTEDQRLFELCCIPYFTYGQSRGDMLQVTLGTGQHAAQAKSGHRTIRFNFATAGRRAHCTTFFVLTSLCSSVASLSSSASVTAPSTWTPVRTQTPSSRSSPRCMMPGTWGGSGQIPPGKAASKDVRALARGVSRLSLEHKSLCGNAKPGSVTMEL